MFSRFQVEFCKGRSWEDQNSPSNRRWFPTSLDETLCIDTSWFRYGFDTAYDTVWKEKLVLHMLNTSIPATFIHWIQSFLNDRRGRVQLFDVFSSSWRFTQGLSKGSILAPLLFLFYINDFASLLMMSLSSLRLVKRKMIKLLPSQ